MPTAIIAHSSEGLRFGQQPGWHAKCPGKAEYPAPVVVAMTADGAVYRYSFDTPKGKPVNFERADRVVQFIAERIALRPIVSHHVEHHGERLDRSKALTKAKRSSATADQIAALKAQIATLTAQVKVYDALFEDALKD